MRAGRGLIKYGRLAVVGKAGARGKKDGSDVEPFDRNENGVAFAMDRVGFGTCRLRLSL